MLTQKRLNDLTRSIIGAAIEVHRELGPGLLESVYEKCMRYLLIEKGLIIAAQQKVPIIFRGLYLNTDLRLDLLVEDCIILKIKAVDYLLPVHLAQMLTYLKLLQKPKGIIINFNCTNIFKEGQKTMVTDLYTRLPNGY